MRIIVLFGHIMLIKQGVCSVDMALVGGWFSADGSVCRRVLHGIVWHLLYKPGGYFIDLWMGE